MPLTFTDRLKLQLNEFSANTSAHGIPRAYYSSTGLRRILWMILFVACLSAFTVQAYLITARFFRNDIIVNVELRFERIAFPSVTVCNLNPYKNSLARVMGGNVEETLKAFDRAMEEATTVDQNENRRKRRSIVEPLTIRCNCPSSNGPCFPMEHGDSDCVCYSNENNAWNCEQSANWRDRICDDCDEKTGICKKTTINMTEKSLFKWPCTCSEKNNHCLLHPNEQVEFAWPLLVSTGQCKCNGRFCSLMENGDEFCYCIDHNGHPICSPYRQWSLASCSHCSWTGECERSSSPSLNNNLNECLCHEKGPCFAIEKTSFPSSSNGLRIKRSPSIGLEPVFGHMDSLMAVYSKCDCRGHQCVHVDDQSHLNSTICLCFYKKNGAIWPCYRPEHWFESRCPSCNTLGNCEYAKEGSKIPCACVTVIKMCVRIDEPAPNGTEAILEPGMFLADRLIKLWEITSTPDSVLLKTEEDREEAFGLKGVSDPVAIKTKAAENMIFAVNALNETEKEALSYSKREFITKCSFNGKPCTIHKDFTLHLDPTFGNCFTFNSNSSEHMISERAGPAYGLRFQVFVNISDYLPTTEASGVRITVHDLEEQPFPDTLGYSAPTGFVSSFGIRLKHMTRLPYPYGECVREGKDQDFIYQDRRYSTEGCQRSCVQKFLVDQCGCGDPRFPPFRDHLNCPATDPISRACVQREVVNAAREVHLARCNCRQPCSEHVYTVAYSAARWPSSPQTASECTFGTKKLSPMQCLSKYREEGALIEVYYEQLNYESLLESEAYGLPNLLSDFGGQLGLWMGVSVITISEFLILAFDILVALLFCCGGGDGGHSETKDKIPLNGTTATEENNNKVKVVGRRERRRQQSITPRRVAELDSLENSDSGRISSRF